MHVRQFPIGVPFRAQLPSAIGTYWDNAIAECVDGVGGGTYSGAIVLSATSLTGTSGTNTTGDIIAHDIHATHNLIADNLAQLNGNVAILGLLSCNGDIDLAGSVVSQADGRFAQGAVEGTVIVSDKVVPRSINEQTIDCNGGAAIATLDLTLHDNFVIHLFDSGGGTETAVLHAIHLTTVTANLDLQIKKGAKFRVIFDSSAQSGGIGLDFGPWPVTCFGYTKSDALGPCTGDVTGVGGENDFMIWELENVGSVGSPRFYATLIKIGGGL